MERVLRGHAADAGAVAMKGKATPTAPALSREDLALCVSGPWDPRAGISGDKVLWDPRCETARPG